MADGKLSIGQVSKRTGIPVRTLRFWSDEGLVPPSGRTQSGYRLYSEADLVKLDLVRTLRDAGLGLDSIGAVLRREHSLADVIVPRLGSYVATSAHAVKNIAFHKRTLASFLELALEKTVSAADRSASDPPRLQLLHLANMLACTGVASSTAWSGLRPEIDRAVALGFGAWKPFRKSDNYTPALAALALGHPRRAEVIAQTPRLGESMGPPATTLEVFIDLVTEGTPETRQRFYDELLMHFVVDFASDYPAPDGLTTEEGPRFFDPSTMLWVARIHHSVLGGMSVGSVAKRLRQDLRDYTGLRD